VSPEQMSAASAVIDIGAAGRPPPVRRRWGDRRLGALLAGCAALAIAALHGPRPGFVLDDWYLVERALDEGATGVVGNDLVAARPGSFLVYLTSFGIMGDRPIGLQVVQAAWLAAAAVLAFLVLARFARREVALSVVLLWLVLPNHLSLEIWPAALVADAGLVYLLGALLLLSSPVLDRWWILGACVLTALACVTYEASIVAAAAAFVAIPWLIGRRVRWDAVAAGAVTLTFVLAWQLTHWHEVKRVDADLGALAQMVPAHLGWGIVPAGPVATVTTVAALVGSVLVAARFVTRSRAGKPVGSEGLVLAGWVVVVVGALPFGLYYYAPLGAGDRVNYLSSLGGAMVIAGLLWCLGRRSLVVAVTMGAALVIATIVVRVERTEVWRTAAYDATAIANAAGRVGPGCRVIVIGPAPIQRENVAAFLDQSNVDAMVKVARRDPTARGGISYGAAAFAAQPAECRVDIRPISDLVADVDLVR
jgi:hypothetical protein